MRVRRGRSRRVILARLEVGPAAESSRAASIAWANRLLGRTGAELEALARVALEATDTAEALEARVRIAVLRADTVEAAQIDGALAEQSGRPLRMAMVRGRLLVARARLAAGFGRRNDAVAYLQEARTRGHIPAAARSPSTETCSSTPSAVIPRSTRCSARPTDRG